MVESTLTEEMIKNGKELILRLEDSDVRPDAAFWFYFPDNEDWNLVLAEVKVGKLGARQVYQGIQTIISQFSDKLGELSLDNITFAKPDAPIVELLRVAMGTGELSGIRFTNNVVNGTFIEDAYIYRL